MLTLLVREVQSPFVIPAAEAMVCLDCDVIYRLARLCPACGRDSGALVAGSWFAAWRATLRKREGGTDAPYRRHARG